jgi:hypothetical protein
MLIFADYLTAGTHKYSYVVQATVEGMYEPGVSARSQREAG